MDSRRRRIGANEAIFRSLNDQVQALQRTFTVPAETMAIVCECGIRSCTVQFQVPPDVYERVREDARLFLVRPDHDLPEAETVVERYEGYWIVRKHPGVAVGTARVADSRG